MFSSRVSESEARLASGLRGKMRYS